NSGLCFLDPHLTVLVADRCLDQRHVLARQAQPLGHPPDGALLDHLVFEPPPWAPSLAGRLRALLDLLNLLARHPLEVGATVAKLDHGVGAEPLGALGRIEHWDVNKLASCTKLQRKLIAAM